MNKHVNNQGFSLIEIMVVIVIMGILTTVVATNVIENIYTGKVTKAKSDIVILESALDFYKMDAGKYPTTEQGLQALVEKPTVAPIPHKYNPKGYLKKPILPKDPWGRPYQYLSPGSHFDYDILSYGADGQSGGEERDKDIVSWEVGEM